MQSRMTISLHDLEFQAFHGLYPEERLTGNQFKVDLKATYLPPDDTIVSIEQTVNYVNLFSIIKNRMDTPVDLLESLAMQITEDIHNRFPAIIKISISIRKVNPPVLQFTGSVGVCFEKEY